MRLPQGSTVETVELGYGASAQPGVFVERRTARRAALVLTTIAVMMVACAKVSMSGALQRSTGVSNMGEAGFRLELAEEATSAPAGDTEDGGNVCRFRGGWSPRGSKKLHAVQCRT